MNLEYLVKWQENQLRPNKKETENGIYKVGLVEFAQFILFLFVIFEPFCLFH